MEQKAPDDKTLRKVLSEVINEYSSFEYNGSVIYIKHFGHEDQSSLENHYEQIYKKAQKQGLPTEKEAVELLQKEDLWTEKDEASLSTAEKYLENLHETKKNLIIPSQIVQIEKDIEKAQEDYDKHFGKKKSLLSETCETYSTKKNNDYSLYLSFYKHADCQEKFFSKEEFDTLSKNELSNMLQHYVDYTSHLSIGNIKYLAINNIFMMYYNLLGKDNLHSFFKKPIYQYTFYQLNLLNYAKILNSIIENSEKMPEQVKEHPDRILDFAEAQRKNKDVISRTQGKQGASIMGATTQDMKDMGVADELSLSPFDLAKEKGSLTIEDFQNFA